MLKDILNDCKNVVKYSEYVKIEEEKINEFVKKIDIKKLENKYWLQDSPYKILDLDIKNLINFMFIYTSINFSFWGNPKWKVKVNNKIQDGSIGLMGLLLEYNNKYGIMKLGTLSKEEFYKVFKGNIQIPLIEKRYNNVCSVCKTINSKYRGNVYDYLKDYTTDEELFNFIILNFKCFRDIEEFTNDFIKNKKVRFYKLAQLLTSDILHIRKIKENIDVDYSNLVGCADYKIPQILRMLELIKYDEELSNIIDNKIEIKKGSKYEIEIRAATIVTINLIKEKLNFNNAIDINDYIWLQGQKGLNVKPYHLVRTNLY